MTDVMFAAASATACKFAITASRPSHNPAFTTGRRSSMKLSSVSVSASAAQFRAAKYAKKRSSARVAAFSSRVVWELQFVEARERGVEVCLVENLAAADQVAFDRKDVRHAPLAVETPL